MRRADNSSWLPVIAAAAWCGVWGWNSAARGICELDYARRVLVPCVQSIAVLPYAAGEQEHALADSR
jgi:hypothetical protein